MPLRSAAGEIPAVLRRRGWVVGLTFLTSAVCPAHRGRPATADGLLHVGVGARDVRIVG